MGKPKLRVEDDIRFQVFARAFYRCERCGGAITSSGVSVHHRQPRKMGGSKRPELHQPANLIVLCGSGTTGCHGWVESHRHQARESGYLIYAIDNAEDIPFVDNEKRVWFIDNQGGKRQLATKYDKP